AAPAPAPAPGPSPAAARAGRGSFGGGTPPIEIETRPGYDLPPDQQEEGHEFAPPTLHIDESHPAHPDAPAQQEPIDAFEEFCAHAGSHLELLDCRFAWVPAGHFTMGREVGKANERPTHPVQISTGYFLSQGTVTNRLFKCFVDATGHPPPGHPRHPERNLWKGVDFPADVEEHPVVNVSWNDARLFCAWLTEWAHEHNLLNPHAAVELPTEAQWEFACRGGPSQMRLKQPTIVSDRDDALGVPTAPSLFEPAPPLGLCGMLGNVWEWILDGYAPYLPSPAGQPQIDPLGAPEGPHRVIRGGGWRSKADLCNPYERAELPPHRTEPSLGFRIAVVYRPVQ
ncbi:MAG: formylglycine-generating enzyme family protein, partial [Planctomycetota bacterium]